MGKFLSLHSSLESNGWSITSIELRSDCWWATEIWELRSIWSPRDKLIYLTLLVDPMFEGDQNNVPDTAVWAVGVTEAVPNDRFSCDSQVVPVQKQFRAAALEIVKLAAATRNKTG